MAIVDVQFREHNRTRMSGSFPSPAQPSIFLPPLSLRIGQKTYNDIADINKPVTATATYPMTDDYTSPGDTDDNVVVQTDRSGEARSLLPVRGYSPESERHRSHFQPGRGRRSSR